MISFVSYCPGTIKETCLNPENLRNVKSDA